MVTWRAPKYPANPFRKATSSPPPPEGSGTIRGAWSSASAPKNIWPNGGPSGRPQASAGRMRARARSEEHTSELQSHSDLVCRLLLEKKKKKKKSRKNNKITNNKIIKKSSRANGRDAHKT